MSSSIAGVADSWRVPNMMFWRVVGFACEVGGGLAATPSEREWVARLSRLEGECPTYSPDLDVAGLFGSRAEALFWADVLSRLAELVYERRVGDQGAQDWQVATIWAAYDLSRLLSVEAEVGRWPPEAR